jgi:hypothetical protein
MAIWGSNFTDLFSARVYGARRDGGNNCWEHEGAATGTWDIAILCSFAFDSIGYVFPVSDFEVFIEPLGKYHLGRSLYCTLS